MPDGVDARYEFEIVELAPVWNEARRASNSSFQAVCPQDSRGFLLFASLITWFVCFFATFSLTKHQKHVAALDHSLGAKRRRRSATSS